MFYTIGIHGFMHTKSLFTGVASTARIKPHGNEN